MPVPPILHNLRGLIQGDGWVLQEAGAMFAATVVTVRESRADLPAMCGPVSAGASCRVIGSGPNAVREDRLAFGSGGVRISRWITHGGQAYLITYMRAAPRGVANLKGKDDTPSDAAGESFVASLSVSGPGSK